jgi:hypothetical protein
MAMADLRATSAIKLDERWPNAGVADATKSKVKAIGPIVRHARRQAKAIDLPAPRQAKATVHRARKATGLVADGRLARRYWSNLTKMEMEN